MLDLKLDRAAAPPKDAATIVLVRDAATGDGIELFCVERSKQSRFLGGAIVFPGGKLDASDASGEGEAHDRGARARARTRDPVHDRRGPPRALAIAASRGTLEEAAMLHVVGEGRRVTRRTSSRSARHVGAGALPGVLADSTCGSICRRCTRSRAG